MLRFRQYPLQAEAGGAGDGGGGAGGAAGGEAGGAGGAAGGKAGETGGGSFLESLPEDLRGEPSLKDFKDVTGLAKSLVATKRMLGNAINIPSVDAGEDAKREFYEKLAKVPGVTRLPAEGDAEGWNQFFAKLGRPEKAEAYSFERPELPKGYEYDNTVEDKFRKVAHEAGLTQQQFRQVLGWYNKELQLPLIEEHAKQVKEASEALRKEWGNDYDRHLGLGRLVLKKFGSDELVAEVNEYGLDNLPSFAKFLSKIAMQTLEDEVVKGSHGGGLVSAEELRLKLTELRSNPAYYDRDKDPALHKSLVERVNSLSEQLYNLQNSA